MMNVSPYLYHIPSSDFPSDVLKWMKADAKPKMAIKLMKCHKCFQHKEFPYWVTVKLKISDNKWNFISLDQFEHSHQEIKDGKNVTKKILKRKRKHNDGDLIFNESEHGYEEYEESDTKKFWITGYLCLQNVIPNLTTHFFPKVAVCEIESLRLLRQNLIFDEFKLLTTSGKVTEIFLSGTKIIFKNDEPIFIDSILKCVPKLERFQCYNNEQPLFPYNFTNVINSIDTSKIEFFSLHMISYSDFENFKHFMEKNRHTFFEAIFTDNSLSVEETEGVASYVQDIINVGVTENPPPVIIYPEQTEEQRNSLTSLFEAFRSRNESDHPGM